MQALFPFEFPAATAFYLSLYLATLVLHVVFMNYVLAGSAYLAWFALRTANGGAKTTFAPLADPLRDWLPFMLSAAITAGVAPLLFVQILYQQSFYSANLLLFHRWMAIVPVLIVGFYLLYLLKSRMIGAASLPWRIAVGTGAFACFAFTAWSWTENHLLSLNETVWPAHYASGRLFYSSAELPPRLALWFCGAFPTMAVAVAWQNWYFAGRDAERDLNANRDCTRVALPGLVVSVVVGLWYAFSLDANVRSQLVGSSILPWLVLAGVGLIIQAAGWWIGRNEPVLTTKRLLITSTGCLLTISGTSVLREARRLAAIDISHLYELHADAARVGGLVVFLVFTGLNTALIAWCLRIVRRGLKDRPTPPTVATM